MKQLSFLGQSLYDLRILFVRFFVLLNTKSYIDNLFFFVFAFTLKNNFLLARYLDT